ncbi:hypothetical protein DFH09DRAFT_1413580 [Mycena vulgaris]|nr:hypothetical protein DFH09DRAFT_1413580 [Mycena vulgaris]
MLALDSNCTSPARPRPTPIFLCNPPLQKPPPGLDGDGIGGSLSVTTPRTHTSRRALNGPVPHSIQLISPSKEGSASSLAACSLTIRCSKTHPNRQSQVPVPAAALSNPRPGPPQILLNIHQARPVPPLRLATPVPLRVPANRPHNANHANFTLPLPPRPSHDTLAYIPSSTPPVLLRLTSRSSSIAFQTPACLSRTLRFTAAHVIASSAPLPHRPFVAARSAPILSPSLRRLCICRTRFLRHRYAIGRGQVPVPVQRLPLCFRPSTTACTSPQTMARLYPRTPAANAHEECEHAIFTALPATSTIAIIVPKTTVWGVVRPQDAVASPSQFVFRPQRSIPRFAHGNRPLCALHLRAHDSAAPPACVTLEPTRAVHRTLSCASKFSPHATPQGRYPSQQTSSASQVSAITAAASERLCLSPWRCAVSLAPR